MAQSCLLRAQGNQREADYLLECGYFEYYWRVAQYNKWAKEQERQMKEAQNKNK